MKAFKWFGIILVVLTVVLSACGGAPAAAPTAVPPAARAYGSPADCGPPSCADSCADRRAGT